MRGRNIATAQAQVRRELEKAFELIARRWERQARKLSSDFQSLRLHWHQAARYLEIYGHETYELLLAFHEKRVMRSIRVNTLLVKPEELERLLREKGLAVQKHPYIWYGLVVEETPHPLGALHEYMLGLYTIQGPASMMAVPALDPKQGQRIADMCAGAGVKTTQISQHAPTARILALDINRRKLLALKNNASRLAAFNIVAVQMDARNLPKLGKFNAILLDAPCSGEGLLHIAKGRWPRTFKDTLSRVQLQLQLLDAGVKALARGGVLVYSTCTLSVEENEYVVSKILEHHEDIDVTEPPIPGGSKGVESYANLPLNPNVKRCRRYTPHKDRTEGFTICRLERKS